MLRNSGSRRSDFLKIFEGLGLQMRFLHAWCFCKSLHRAQSYVDPWNRRGADGEGKGWVQNCPLAYKAIIYFFICLGAAGHRPLWGVKKLSETLKILKISKKFRVWSVRDSFLSYVCGVIVKCEAASPEENWVPVPGARGKHTHTPHTTHQAFAFARRIHTP